MRAMPRLLFLGSALLCLAGPAAAQYLKITTDNPTDNTRMRATGTTILTLSLNTNHDRNGSLQTCNSHTAALGCGAATPSPLDIGSYTLTLSAVGGTVTWGAYSPANAAYADLNGGVPIMSNTQIEVDYGRASGFDTPGLYTLGTIPVTPSSGVPSIDWGRGAQPVNPFGFGTGFGTECDANNFPNTYVLADPGNLCATGDFADADGAFAAAQEQPTPAITAPATASGAEGSTFSITATATHPTSGEILCITVSGQPPDVSFSTVCGTSPLTATLTGTPGFNDAGSYVIRWVVTDSHQHSSSATTSLVIANTNRPPTLNPVANMSTCGPPDQTITGSDPDGDALTFSKAAGPTFMTVTTTSPTVGNIHIAPGFADGPTGGRSDDRGGADPRTDRVGDVHEKPDQRGRKICSPSLATLRDHRL